MKEWIQTNFTPVVMVISSPECEALCQEANGLNIVDVLRPFGFLQQLSGELAPTLLFRGIFYLPTGCYISLRLHRMICRASSPHQTCCLSVASSCNACMAAKEQALMLAVS